MVDLYYNSYSLCTYETIWNAEAFIDTTVIPLILMFVINLLVLCYHMKFSPLDFLRRDLKKKKKKKAFRLNTKIPFLHRFRLRILFQNIELYHAVYWNPACCNHCDLWQDVCPAFG
jgi:putative ABC transport system permease protein